MKNSSFFLFFLLLVTGLLLPGFSYRTGTSIPYKVQAKQSKVRWTGYYVFSFGEHTGTIDLLTGEIQADNQDITDGFFDIDMTSIKDLDMPEDDGGKDLVTHLMSEDFFVVDKFPVARFTITKTEKIKDATVGAPNFFITGDLNIREVKKSLTFPAVITFQENKVTASAKFKFDRTKWGIHYSSGKFFSDVGDGAISDAIAIEIDLVALK